MEAAETPELYADDPDNLTLNRLIDDCAGFGMSQHDVAEVLRISPGQLSRVRKGERHAALKHIRGLRTHLRTRRKRGQVHLLTSGRRRSIVAGCLDHRASLPEEWCSTS
jgi:hypothetical protein